MKTITLKKAALFFIISIMVNTSFSQGFSELLDGYYAYNRFWGSVLIVQNESVLFQKSYGYADKDKKIKNDEHTIFDLGSVTKTMTAVAILKLHDEGKLSIFDRVDNYIPNFINDNTEGLTILNLLNHTSGMSANLARNDDDGSEIVLPSSAPITLENLIEKFKSSKLKNKPGSNFEYNNYGYSLLAYIIEKVSGMSYPEYINSIITTTLNMENTYYKLDLQKTPATGYSGIGTNHISKTSDDFHPSWVIGAGYMYSSTNDLAKYVQAVFSHHLFSEKTLKLMMDTCVNTKKANKYWALGWEKQKTEGLEWYTHGGGIFGFSTRIGYIPEKNISIIVLSNLVKDLKFDDAYSSKFSFVEEITQNIIKLINSKEVTYLPVPKGKPDKKICGTYKFDDTHSATLRIQNDSLFLSTSESDDFTLFDYTYNKEISDTKSIGYSICTLFSESLLSGNFEGCEKFASEEIKTGLFSEKGISKIKSAWKSFTTSGGNFLSYNVFNKADNNYLIAFHYEKTDIILQLSFNTQDLIQGLFFVNVLPKCSIYRVHLVPTGNNTYFVDGYKSDGNNDIRITYNAVDRSLEFTSDNYTFSAVQEK